MTLKQLATPLIAAALVVLLAFPGVRYVVDLTTEREAARLRVEALNESSRIRVALESAVTTNVLLAGGLVGEIGIEGDITPTKFDAFVNAVMGDNPLLRGLTMAPDGILSWVFPRTGNEEAIGVDLFADPVFGPTARRARDSGDAVMVGPVALPQGGKAFVVRIPVHTKDGRFWGLLGLALDKDKLIAHASLTEPHPVFEIGLRTVNADDLPGEVFHGSPEAFTPQSLVRDVTLAAGVWQLGIVPRLGWSGHSEQLPLMRGVSISILVLLGTIAFVVTAFFTASRRLAANLQVSEARLRAAALASGDGFCLLADDDRVLLCNDGFAEVYGTDAKSMIGRRLEQVMAEAHAKGAGFLLSEDQSFEQWLGEIKRHRSAAGRDITITVQASDGRWFFVREREAETGEHVMVRTDITAMKTLEAELRRLATSDSLTGAANRRFFMERAAAEWERFRRYSRPLTVMMLDIDHFKRINDNFGHPIGDEALRTFTVTVGARLRNNDLLGRLGGEEFAVLLPETALQGAEVMAERLRSAVEQIRIDTAKGPLGYTMSVGVAICDPADGNIERSLKRADDALYEAKHSGRNRVVVAESGAGVSEFASG